MKQTVIAGLAALLLVGLPYPSNLDAQQSNGQQSTAEAIDSTRAAIEQWVETRHRIARSRADWRQEKQLIENRIVVFREEIAQLEINIEQLEERVSGAERQRAELRAQADEFRRASRVVDDVVAQYERRVTEVARYFPRPLRDRISPLLERIPDEPRRTNLSTSERMMAVVGILNEADTFNTQVTIVRERRELPDGRLAEVSAIYFGLGQAYYVDAQGRYAGIGSPGPDGWEWEQRDDAAPAIARAVHFYNTRGEAAFVELPVTIDSLPGIE